MKKYFVDKILQKARWVHRRYPELNIEDLVQEGSEIVTKIHKATGNNINRFYIVKALSNHFSNIIRNTNSRKGIHFVSLDALGEIHDCTIPNETMDIENNIDRERFAKTLRNKNLVQTLHGLMEGNNIEEIARARNCSTKTIHRQIKLLQRLREKWEK